jgi:hypothetical protein
VEPEGKQDRGAGFGFGGPQVATAENLVNNNV